MAKAKRQTIGDIVTQLKAQPLPKVVASVNTGSDDPISAEIAELRKRIDGTSSRAIKTTYRQAIEQLQAEQSKAPQLGKVARALVKLAGEQGIRLAVAGEAVAEAAAAKASTGGGGKRGKRGAVKSHIVGFLTKNPESTAGDIVAAGKGKGLKAATINVALSALKKEKIIKSKLPAGKKRGGLYSVAMP